MNITLQVMLTRVEFRFFPAGNRADALTPRLARGGLPLRVLETHNVGLGPGYLRNFMVQPKALVTLGSMDAALPSTSLARALLRLCSLTSEASVLSSIRPA